MGGSFCDLPSPLPLLVAAIICVPANYRIVHLVFISSSIFGKHFKFTLFSCSAFVGLSWKVLELNATWEATMFMRTSLSGADVFP